MYTPPPSEVRSRLLRWYSRFGRDLPWRRTGSPYRILVSEVMLQQTQVARVVPAYHAFVARFPTLATLARAPLSDVLRAWAGLGYNRRALNLQRAARATGRALPRDTEALRALPGIGPYTAAAVACFAHGAAVPLADTNVRRVLGRLVLGRVASDAEAVALDAAYLAPRRSASWHHAVMDLGATVCVARNPRCGGCPLASVCAGRGTRGEAPRRAQAPFATSDRRVRGTIVRLLREAPDGMTVSALARAAADARVARLVEALRAEGLVVRRGRRVVLPR